MDIPRIIKGSTFAIDKIKVKGYASYSSLKDVRDGWNGKKFDHPALDIGGEVHSRWLEKKVLQRFSPSDEKMIKGMVASLNSDKLATKILDGAAVEEEFKIPIMGLPILGYIDILPPKKIIGDLKTTKHTSEKDFVKSMDFLQAAIYLTALKREDFYYIGISKVNPYSVFTFRVSQYPKRLQSAHNELKQLITYVKNKLKE